MNNPIFILAILTMVMNPNKEVGYFCLVLTIVIIGALQFYDAIKMYLWRRYLRKEKEKYQREQDEYNRLHPLKPGDPFYRGCTILKDIPNFDLSKCSNASEHLK